MISFIDTSNNAKGSHRSQALRYPKKNLLHPRYLPDYQTEE